MLYKNEIVVTSGQFVTNFEIFSKYNLILLRRLSFLKIFLVFVTFLIKMRIKCMCFLSIFLFKHFFFLHFFFFNSVYGIGERDITHDVGRWYLNVC